MYLSPLANLALPAELQAEDLAMSTGSCFHEITLTNLLSMQSSDINSLAFPLLLVRGMTEGLHGR